MKTLKQVLEAKLAKNEKPTPSSPVEPDSVTSLTPKTKDEKRFMDKHVVQKVDDRNGNGDDHFRATNVQAYDRSASNHGYNTKEDQAVYESKSLKQILGEKHLTPAEMKKREDIAQGIEKSNPGMAMGKKMAIATAQAKKVAESFEEFTEQFEQLDEAARHDQYATYHAGVKDMLKKIGAHADQHKEYSMSPTEWNKEKGANMNSGHVYTMKNLHRTLQDLHDDLQQNTEYTKPYQAPKIKKEEVDLFDVFADDVRDQVKEVFENLNEENKQVMIEMIEAQDYDTVVEVVKEVLNA
jgi:coenzyme F420-reducing hydrogenase delta subunit